MSTMSDFVNSGASNQAQVDANTKILQYMPNRNRIINGKMEIAQRGTSFTATAGYHLDRYWTHSINTAAYTTSQQTDAPVGFQSSLRIAVTTADASIAASDLARIEQVIEGYNIADLVGRPFTLSFWVRSSKTGTHSVMLQNSANNYSYVTGYTISAANTWEFKTITVGVGLPSAGAWNYTNGGGLRVGFVLCCGSTYATATLNTWVAGEYMATTNQVNCLDTVGNIFAITGVQLEAGESATPFEHRLYGQELALCQRYFCKSYSYDIPPASSGNNKGNIYIGTGTANTSPMGVGVKFPCVMRTVPSIIAYDLVGAAGKCYRGANGSAATISDAGDSGFTWIAEAGANTSTVQGHYIAIAEL